MMSTKLSHMSLREICNLYKSGGFPESFKDLSLADIVKIADQEDPGHDEIQVRFDELDPGQEGLERVERTFTWREEKPNSNNTNPPLLLWRGDENNDATISLAFGVYDQEFTDLKEEYMKIEVETSDGRKLARKALGTH